jgi:Family of unknown function (DUF6529)
VPERIEEATVAIGTAGRATTSVRASLAAVLLLGVAVALALGVYSKVHTPAGRPITTFGFSGMLQMKTWLTTAALVLVVVQVLTALAMWGQLPGVTSAPSWVAQVHRWSGTTAFILTLPVAVHCVWSLGFSSGDARTLVHSVAGCLFYGAFAAKMLGLRLRGLPSWAIALLGGTLFTLFVVLWLSAALWFFTRPGLPLT